MVALVQLEETKLALRVWHDDDDIDLSGIIEAASEAVIDYLDTRAESYLTFDSGGDIASESSVPEKIKRATMIVCQHLYEPDDDAKMGPGGLPHRAEMLLYRLADPPLA
ncbi:head-tail connector protein [Roseovarius indicus]|uniref:Phage gp6-like head-tail connector protein n=1 Tax=Roseovarius indicus TaxID=540747 RepID=A0A0T5P941_9RHOB|nr:head-tail connector protein [Roseovarius indicus]KRS17528.1 hypothetical protein XM52_13700 [Roseovarius indicus]QEW26732.1 Phage gp6-like head-tail connector protein [Roseovarius indicus]SFD60927.1 Phage gp6-like head-tail connector protein [Roseovarius indicus]